MQASPTDYKRWKRESRLAEHNTENIDKTIREDAKSKCS